jgi:hypothetical protein
VDTDVSFGKYSGRGAHNNEEEMKRKLEKGPFLKSHKLIERLHDGNYVVVGDNVKTEMIRGPSSEEKLEFNKKKFEQQLLEAQVLWIHGLNQIYELLLGLLAGMNLVIAIMLQMTKNE